METTVTPKTPEVRMDNGLATKSWSEQDLKRLVQKQRDFFLTGKTRDLKFRKQALTKLLNLISGNQPAILKALREDLGKPELEAYSTEIAYVLEDVKHVLKSFQEWAEPQRVSTPLVLQPATSELHSEPFGTTLIIAPWNYPFQLVVSPLIGAIAAGNTAVLKPSEATPATQALLQKLIGETYEDEYIACVGGGLEESQALLEQHFDFIFFTGSPRVGQIVMEKAAKNLTPVCLELGGKSPCIVDKNVDLKVAARRVVWGKFMNAGQTCVAPDYLLIHKEIYTDFVNSLKTAIKEFYGDDPLKSDSYARIVNKGHFKRLVGFLKGGNVSGGRHDESQLYIEPTLIEDIDLQHPLMKEEIFGPILPLIKYSETEEALRTIRQQTKPLAFYVFTKNKKLQNTILEQMPFGGACVNDCVVHLANPNLPFGGIGTSGMGMYHGKYSFEAFSHKKSVLRKPFALDATMRYAPYTQAKLKLIKFFMG